MLHVSNDRVPKQAYLMLKNFDEQGKVNWTSKTKEILYSADIPVGVDIPVGLHCCSEPISYAAVEEDGTCGLVIEVFDDLDKVCADVVLLHSCPQSCMQNPVKGLLEVYEDMVEVLLVLEIFLTENA